MNRVSTNAFTLMEMLTVVIILGIISAIAIPSISNIMNSNKNRMYSTYMKIVEEKTNLLIDQYKGEFKNSNSNCFQINYQSLIDSKFLTESDIHCSGSIVITKSGSNQNFTSEYYLNCFDKDGNSIHKIDKQPPSCSNFSIN